MNSSIISGRSFLSGSRSVQYDFSSEITTETLTAIFKACSDMVSKLIYNRKVIINLKGRDQLNTISDETRLPFENELFSYQVIRHEEERGKKHLRNFFILTPFVEFEKNDILHSVKSITIPEQGTELSLASPLTDASPGLESLRLGLDFYGQNSFASWFFRTPVVTRTFLLEAGGCNLSLRLNAEEIRQGQDLLPAPLETFVAELGNILLFNFTEDLKIKTVSIY